MIRYFTCSSLLDNFFDRKELSHEAIEHICFHPNTYAVANFDETIFRHCHTSLLAEVNDVAWYWKVSTAELQSQQDSLQQFDVNISDEKLKAITDSKGGNAVLMCQFYLDHEPSEAETNCFYQLGSIIQLTNDLFDIYKDLQDGIQTLPVRCKDALQMKKYVLEKIRNLKKEIRALPVDSKTKHRFSISIAGVYAFSLIAVDQLKRLQGKFHQLPPLKDLPRKALIIDMEKPVNIRRWFQFVYRYARL